MRSFQSIVAVSLVIIASMLVVLVFGKIDNASAEPEIPANALPVYCRGGAVEGYEEPFLCRRSDTDAEVGPVPAGQYLIVTDIYVTRSSAATTGIASVTIGVDDPDSFPSEPRINITSTPIGAHMNFTAPYIVLDEGELLSLNNSFNSNFVVQASVSGFLVDDVTYQAFFQAYLPVTSR